MLTVAATGSLLVAASSNDLCGLLVAAATELQLAGNGTNESADEV